MTDTADYRRDALVIGLALAAALIIGFAPFLFGGATMMSAANEVPSVYFDGAVPDKPLMPPRSADPGAAGWQNEAWFAIEHRILFEEHRIPFWEPDDGYGTPLIATIVPQPFYPLTTLTAAAPAAAAPRAYAWFLVARLFLAGFFAALFVRLFFTDRWPAIGAGFAGMLAGYLLLFYNLPHLSVEVGFPMLLWATELVVRRASGPRIAALAVTTGLIYLGGMPESAFLALAASSVYALVRILTVDRPRLVSLGAVVAGNVAGFGLGAIEWFPFLELLPRAFSTHDPSTMRGLGYDVDVVTSLLTSFFPRAYGSPWTSILTGGSGSDGTRGFFGCAAFVLALVAAYAGLRRRDRRTPVVAFLVALVLYAFLKRNGSPLVNWTGSLPGFLQIDFPKYIEPLRDLGIAMLAGFGIGFLRERIAGTRTIAAAFALTLALVSGLFIVTTNLVPNTPLAFEYPRAILIGLAALLAATIAALAIVRFEGRAGAAGILIVVLVLFAEPWLGWVRPTLWLPAPPIAENPYLGAPYLSYLADHMHPNEERVFGVSGILFPNWPGAYQLADPRALNPLYTKDYLPFVDAFITKQPPAGDDQADRFTAMRPIPLDAPLVRRWLALSSVGYVLSPAPMIGTGLSLAFGAPGSYVYRVNGSIPRLSLFHRARAAASFAQALPLLTSAGFDVTREVVVEGTAPVLEPARGVESVHVTHTRSDLLEADVEASSTGLLMQNDQWYAGWQATLDGADVPMLRVDGIFRGVVIPAGRHHLALAYRSGVAAAGTWVSMLALLLVLGLFFGSRVTALRRGGAFPAAT